MFSVSPAILISSTYTNRNSPLARLTNKHSQLKKISQPCSNRTFSNCLSHQSPARGWPYKFLSRRTTGSSILDHDFGHLCFGWRIQKCGHSDWIFLRTWCTFHFDLSLNGYCICCLTWTTWKPWYNVHDFCGCHLGRWWFMFSEYCIRPWIVFYNITSEYNSTFAFWCFASNSAFFWWHMSINDAKWTVAPDVFASSITCFLFLTFVSCNAGIFSSFSHSLSTAAFAAGIFIARGIGMNLWTRL